MVGLSALMTTTVVNMKETIQLLRQETPWAKIMVGGAPVTEAFCQKIGADKYTSDAASAADWAVEACSA